MQFITECPVCQGSNFEQKLICKDFTVSHETFIVAECTTCTLRITSPRPEPNDLGKFYLSEKYISHTDSDRSIFGLTYRLSRSLNIRWKYRLVRRYSNGRPSPILDFGCGTGSFLKKCVDQNEESFGIEPSEIARGAAKARTGAPVESDLKNFNHKVKTITAWHVLEHVPDLSQTLKDLHNILDKNGTMFIAVPNYESQDARHYKENWAGYDVPRHLWHFSKLSMTRLLNSHNFDLIGIVPMKLDAFYVSLLSEKNLSTRSPIRRAIRGLIHGIRSNLKAMNHMNHSSLIYIARKR
jgi:SAM-dependent methyltransferase